MIGIDVLTEFDDYNYGMCMKQIPAGTMGVDEVAPTPKFQ